MRILRFIVDGQIITPDPRCDFSNLVPGSDGYLKAEFAFSSEWDGCIKVVGFYSILGLEYEPQALNDGKSCIIPSEALENKTFKVQLIGQREGFRMKTNKLAVCQDGGRA